MKKRTIIIKLGIALLFIFHNQSSAQLPKADYKFLINSLLENYRYFGSFNEDSNTTSDNVEKFKSLFEPEAVIYNPFTDGLMNM